MDLFFNPANCFCLYRGLRKRINVSHDSREMVMVCDGKNKPRFPLPNEMAKLHEPVILSSECVSRLFLPAPISKSSPGQHASHCHDSRIMTGLKPLNEITSIEAHLQTSLVQCSSLSLILMTNPTTDSLKSRKCFPRMKSKCERTL